MTILQQKILLSTFDSFELTLQSSKIDLIPMQLNMIQLLCLLISPSQKKGNFFPILITLDTSKFVQNKIWALNISPKPIVLETLTIL